MCDKLSLVSSWWPRVSWLHVWKIEPCEQLMTLCFQAPCVTNRVLWAADDTRFSGSVCEKLNLMNSWWHHAFWLLVWKIEPSEQLMTLFSGSMYDKSEPSLPGCKLFSGCWWLFFVHVKLATTAVFREEYPWQSLLQQILLQNLISSEAQKTEVFSVVVVSAYLFKTGLEKRYIDSLHPSVMVLHWPQSAERRNGNPVLYSDSMQLKPDGNGWQPCGSWCDVFYPVISYAKSIILLPDCLPWWQILPR